MNPITHNITGDPLLQKQGFILTPAAMPVREKIDRWYFEPLRSMDGDDAFICLAICFLLYEKYLLLTGAMPEGQNFTHGHKVFKLVAGQLNTDPDTAFLIWNSWRNGLLHRAMPKGRKSIQWALDGKLSVPVKVEGTTVTLNPWLLRNRILEVVEAKRAIWKDSESPLMNVYEVTPLK
jgi:hypothetical protein